jgi:hypothetical protein
LGGDVGQDASRTAPVDPLDGEAAWRWHHAGADDLAVLVELYLGVGNRAQFGDDPLTVLDLRLEPDQEKAAGQRTKRTPAD